MRTTPGEPRYGKCSGLLIGAPNRRRYAVSRDNDIGPSHKAEPITETRGLTADRQHLHASLTEQVNGVPRAVRGELATRRRA